MAQAVGVINEDGAGGGRRGEDGKRGAGLPDVGEGEDEQGGDGSKRKYGGETWCEAAGSVGRCQER